MVPELMQRAAARCQLFFSMQQPFCHHFSQAFAGLLIRQHWVISDQEVCANVYPAG
jgi:hypothetical protein